MAKPHINVRFCLPEIFVSKIPRGQNVSMFKEFFTGRRRREVVREKRVGGSSTRFPLSRWWGGFLVCRWRRHYESGRWLEWTVRASRESASKEKKKNQHTTTTNSKNESIKNHKRIGDSISFVFSQLAQCFSIVSVCCVSVSSFLCVSDQLNKKKWFEIVKKSCGMFQCLPSPHTHTLWRTHLVDYTH